MTDRRVNRREFIRTSATAAAACAVPTIIPSHALGGDGAVAPSNRITVGMIGVGRQTLACNLPFFVSQPDCEVVALCDVDRWRLETTTEQWSTRERTAPWYDKGDRISRIPKCPRYGDFREVLARKDVDAVMITTPDHWHVPMSVMAVKAGKDVSCEKPLTRSLAEGRYLSDLVTKHKRVFRTDSEFRSLKQFHRAVELVRNGRIGKLHTIRTTVPMGASTSPPFVDMPVPKELNYDMWLGPALVKPYTEQRVHQIKGYVRGGWMNIRDYSDSTILNWSTHLNDIAQWGNNSDRTGPVDVEGHGKYPPPGSLWDALYEFEFTCHYANGVKLICQSAICTPETYNPHTRFEGDEGWIQASYLGKQRLQASSKSLLDAPIGASGLHFPLMHEKRDFLNAVKTRGATLADAEVGHRTASLGHLGQIAIQLGRKLKWDPDKEVFVGDDEANKMRSLPPGRSPWVLEQL
jgi:myo-inositol 2-dehydrogenase / D-chiro-inositol 1-dehydrogenase